MRYIVVDRFHELEPGKYAHAVKCVTKGEPFVADLPAYPSALVLEALLQTGGWLARATSGFKLRSVLGKVEHAEFPDLAHAGERIDLKVEIVLSRAEGTLCEGVATVDERVVGRARFMIVYLPLELMPPEDPESTQRQRNAQRALGISVEEE